ncbi:hypothetical protein [Maribacter sp. 2308TA10-17]|uniref:hypothetical protein n=1 Tax=Maribacter sp. 2308TA10-17 TaxID=3386276 RepID=UPI0039BC46DA
MITSTSAIGQVKVGDNINSIDGSSILELESRSKALVITRLTDAEMNAITPLNGALVYNTDLKCIFVFEGAVWKSLCNSEISVTTSPTSPLNATPGDIWIDETDNSVYVWDGNSWEQIPTNTRSGIGEPADDPLSNPVPGDIHVDLSTGDIYTYDGNNWIDQTITADNGLSQTPNKKIELGGTLTKPTEIIADANNTLAVAGLEEVIDNNNQIVTVEPTTGVLRKTPVSAFLQQEEILIIANEAQTQFTPPLLVTSSKKINVYRNGVKLGYTVVNNSTIELEAPVFCYQNDEIRIVQFY